MKFPTNGQARDLDRTVPLDPYDVAGALLDSAIADAKNQPDLTTAERIALASAAIGWAHACAIRDELALMRGVHQAQATPDLLADLSSRPGVTLTKPEDFRL